MNDEEQGPPEGGRDVMHWHAFQCDCDAGWHIECRLNDRVVDACSLEDAFEYACWTIKEVIRQETIARARQGRRPPASMMPYIMALVKSVEDSLTPEVVAREVEVAMEEIEMDRQARLAEVQKARAAILSSIAAQFNPMASTPHSIVVQVAEEVDREMREEDEKRRNQD